MAQADLVRTAGESGQSVEEARAAATSGIPLGRFVEADEVAALICWLASDQAGAVTGQAYNISCGEFFA
jgi:NAD(P)-dependent dehydrogenase (short-subunit alcohol dehydrogenase family)